MTKTGATARKTLDSAPMSELRKLWPRWLPQWMRKLGFTPAHVRQGIQMGELRNRRRQH